MGGGGDIYEDGVFKRRGGCLFIVRERWKMILHCEVILDHSIIIATTTTVTTDILTADTTTGVSSATTLTAE